MALPPYALMHAGPVASILDDLLKESAVGHLEGLVGEG